MRNLLLLGLLVALAVAAGCSSNSPTGSITGQAGLLSGSMTPPPPPPVVPAGAVYGMTSNVDLTAGTFTVTSPDGKVVDVVLSATTKVLYEGTTADLSASQLVDGLTVTVTGTVIGLPSQSKVRAAMVVINSSDSNREIITGTSID